VGMTEFGSKLRRSIRNLVRETDRKGSQSLCSSYALARIRRAYTTFGRKKLQRRKKQRNKLLMHKIHCIS
jgi:hypothetical protein